MSEKVIEKLKQTYRKNGYDYILEKINDSAAIYRQTYKNVTHGFEVFQIRIRPAFTLTGKSGECDNKVYDYVEKEKFPSDEDFGKWAWAFNTLENADMCFNKIKKFSPTEKEKPVI